jgi:hypothetical protein
MIFVPHLRIANGSLECSRPPAAVAQCGVDALSGPINKVRESVLQESVTGERIICRAGAEQQQEETCREPETAIPLRHRAGP